MALTDASFWTTRLRQTLERYDEPLLRAVAARLFRPRNQWPVADVVERCIESTENPVTLDRRLPELEPASRQILALIARSRQPRWLLGSLVEMTMALGHADGLRPVLALLEAGLLFPDTTEPCKSFEQWLGSVGSKLAVFTIPSIAARAVHEPLDLPDLKEAETGSKVRSLQPVLEADGIEWLLRLAVLWQQTSAVPLRRTMQGGFFKKDAERLSEDPLLTSVPIGQLVEVPDLGFLMAAFAEQEGFLLEADNEVRSGSLPAAWDAVLATALESLWLDLFSLRSWDPLDGWHGEPPAGNPYPSAYLLTFLLLARMPDSAWASPKVLQDWLLEHHPFWGGDNERPSWKKPWLEAFLLGVAYQLRLVQARQGPDGWLVRLAPLGRWLLGYGDAPPLDPVYPQTLLVQPNLEIIAFRQGLTPSLIARLTRFATWKNLGAACTLQLEPDSVYRGLEAGESFESIRLTLEQHNSKAVPGAVLDALRTWSNKRDRITVYPSATLLEFNTPEDLSEALARGLRASRISDTMAVVSSDDEIDYSHFRLTGTRDYGSKLEKCVTAEADGVSLTVDLARSDLLLETDLPRFAVALGPASNGQRHFRLTPASLNAARENGFTLASIESWFLQRTGETLPAAVRMLLTAAQLPPPRFVRQTILYVPAADIADGLLQWPETRGLIESRLGPTALAVSEEAIPLLRERLKAMGVEM